ncbi:MAG: hypothetical protein E7189_05260 [Erysipelotrichaceae bacterium]|uniref:hypothetical protein n=1 Tax=Faecalicoccus sp. TaxID=1971758 RepID=UPI002A7FEB2E|nr:hypothetical protein [Faecalicoccus sp.]MBE6119835.1 hypothetical protein [Erysipelotrichaceae bacterium]MDY4869364.1 hypothetical protein [Faecalicoccus sp.]MDY5232761.1 hypothetical protein [Faecalicoccus sp.]
MPFKIDYEKSQMNAKEYLDRLSCLISTGCYTVQKVPVTSITDSTNLTDLVMVRIPNKHERSVKNDLKMLSRLSTENKRLFYCTHLLGIKMRNLRSDCYTSDYTFGNVYDKYKNMILNFALMREALIEYR